MSCSFYKALQHFIHSWASIQQSPAPSPAPPPLRRFSSSVEQTMTMELTGKDNTTIHRTLASDSLYYIGTAWTQRALNLDFYFFFLLLFLIRWYFIRILYFFRWYFFKAKMGQFRPRNPDFSTSKRCFNKKAGFVTF